MPVQINELVIRANVLETDNRERQTETETHTHTAERGQVNKSEIIKECAELVMEMINNKNQR